MDTRISGDVDNSIKMAKALYKGTQTIRAEEKYTGSAKPPKKKKWEGVFGKAKADEIYNDYVKFYTDAYNNKNMSQVGEATSYFRQVYGKEGDKAFDLLRRNGYTNLKSAPYKLKQKKRWCI